MAIFEPPSSQPREELSGFGRRHPRVIGCGRRKRLRRAGLREHRVGLRRVLWTDRCIRAAFRPFSGWPLVPAIACSRWASGTGINAALYPRSVLGHRHRFLRVDAREGPRPDGSQGHPQRPPARDGRGRSASSPTTPSTSSYAPYRHQRRARPGRRRREMQRVCRPGGRIIVLNHFRSPNPRSRHASSAPSRPSPFTSGSSRIWICPRFIAQADLHPVSIEKVNLAGLWSLITCVKQ